MTKGTSFTRGMRQGFGTGVQLYRDTQDNEVRQQVLKRQLDNEEADREIRRKGLKLQEERDLRDLDARQQGDIMASLRRQMDAEWARDPSNPEVRAREAVIRATNARAQIDEASVTGPGKPTEAQQHAANVRAWADELEKANADLIAAQQSGDQGRVMKAQGVVTAIQGMATKWAEKPTAEPEIDIEVPSDDGVSKMRMKVPQSQWTPQHPMWNKFNPQSSGSGPAMRPGASAPAGTTPTPAAIAYLRANPQLKAEFEAKYGPGSAAAALK